MNKIIAIKLVSGEEIIAHTDSTSTPESMHGNNNVIIVHKARVLHLTGDSQRVGLALAPFMFSCIDGRIYIKINNIMSIASDIPKQIEDTYIEQTSGIALASHT